MKQSFVHFPWVAMNRPKIYATASQPLRVSYYVCDTSEAINSTDKSRTSNLLFIMNR